jgi:hypothetical protein
VPALGETRRRPTSGRRGELGGALLADAEETSGAGGAELGADGAFAIGIAVGALGAADSGTDAPDVELGSDPR